MSTDDERNRDTLEADWARSPGERCPEIIRQQTATSMAITQCALKRGHEGKHVFGSPPYEWK
jgi:hypothetical protein